MSSSKVPSKINFFVWTVALGRILTNENFRKRQLGVIDWCCMCRRVGETINHLLLHCPIVRELRSMVHGVYTFWDILGYAQGCSGASS